jgi:hypothetical protein
LQLRINNWKSDREGVRDAQHVFIVRCGMMIEVFIYSITTMQNNFILFTDLQKRLTPSPIKSWRLLKQLRDDGRMREYEDWIMQDRKLFVNVPRFIVELEQLGYGNLKSDDIKNGGVISNDIKELIDEMKLISSEITERSIQEEMKSPDFIVDEDKRKIEEQDLRVKSPHANLKSNDINNTTNNSNLKSNDFSDSSREIIEGKNELIAELRGSVKDKKDENAELRKMLSESLQRNEKLTQQITFLSNVLAAPKTENEPPREAKVRDINDFSDDKSDITDEITDDDAEPQKTTDTDAAAEDLNREQPVEEMTAEDDMQPAL